MYVPVSLVLHLFLSTPSARRATFTSTDGSMSVWISIHALREEGDVHAAVDYKVRSVFLSTPFARRATS